MGTDAPPRRAAGERVVTGVQITDRQDTDQRALWVTAIALVAVYVVLAWLQRVPAVTTRNDDALYILLAREVASFSYAQEWLLGAPIHAQYPPGFPTWLALLRSTAGEHLGVFAVGNILLVSGGLLLVFDVVRRHWPPVVGVLFLAVAAVSPPLHDAGARILSEGPYFFLTAAALWLAVVKPTGTPWIGMTIAAAVTASLTRSIGLTLIMALGVCWLIQGRRRRVMVLAAAALVLVGSWLTWTVVAPDKFIGGNYVAEMVRDPTGPIRTIWHRLVHHAMAYWTRGVPHSLPLVTIPGTLLDNLVWLLLTTTLAILGVLRLWRLWCGAALYLVGYAGLLLVWPWVDSRLLIPVMPFLTVLLLASLGSPWIQGRWRHAHHAAIALLLLGIAGGVVQQGVPQIKARVQCDRSRPLTAPGCFNDDQRSFFAGASWVNDHLPVDEVVVSAKESTFAYYSDRTVLHPRLVPTSNGTAFLDGMLAVGVHYVFLDRIHPMNRRRIGPLLLPVCGRLRVVASFPPRTYLLSVVRPTTGQDPEAEAQSACEALEYFTENLKPDPTTPAWW